MYKLKLIRGRSYNGFVQATFKEPFVEVKDKETADKLVKMGRFALVSEPENTDNGNETPLEKKTEKQLDKYAAENDIDLTGCKNKTEKFTKIQEALKAASEEDGELNFDDEV